MRVIITNEHCFVKISHYFRATNLGILAAQDSCFHGYWLRVEGFSESVIWEVHAVFHLLPALEPPFGGGGAFFLVSFPFLV